MGAERSPESRQRAEAYWFLASLFAGPPEANQLVRLTALDVQSDGPAGEIVATLRSESPAELADRLAVEHIRLFGGLREGYGPPPPYESLWREGRMMGEAAAAAMRAYGEAGFQPEGRWGPPDHLAEELRFVAALANGEGDAREAGRKDEAWWARERQADFVERHLMGWVPDYCRALESQAREPLYQALARITVETVAGDARYLREDGLD
ncbi:MAG: molecular chaperone TorD family protein [Magnetospirillum sp. WYHS-4]